MYNELLQAAHNLITHSGDVADLHIIGHSRGTVVCSQVLADIIVRPSALWNGSYVEATLLDPHPANAMENSWQDIRKFMNTIAFSRSMRAWCISPRIQEGALSHRVDRAPKLYTYLTPLIPLSERGTSVPERGVGECVWVSAYWG